MRQFYILFLLALIVFSVQGDDSPIFSSAKQVETDYQIALEFSEYNTNRIGAPLNVNVKNCQQVRIFDDTTLQAITNFGTYPYSCKWSTDRVLVVTYNEDVDNDVSALTHITIIGDKIKSSNTSTFSSAGSVPLKLRTPPAQIDSIYTTSYGAEIVVTFTNKIYRVIGDEDEGPQWCSLIFENADTLLGYGALCRIGGTSALMIEVKPLASIAYIPEDEASTAIECTIGSSLVLLPGFIRPVKGSVYSSEGCMNVYSEHTDKPVIELMGPMMSGNCGDDLYYTTQVYNVGLLPIDYHWSITFESGILTPDVAVGIDLVQSILDQASTDDESGINVPSGVMIPENQYTITVTVTVGTMSPVQDSLTFHIVNEPIPVVYPDHYKYIWLTQWESEAVKVSALPPSCSSEINSLSYTWKVNDPSIDLSDMVSANNREIILEGYSFEIGQTYEVSVEVSMEGLTGISIATFEVECIESQLLMEIGSSRTFKLSEAIVFTSTVSDPDESTFDEMAFTWSCIYSDTETHEGLNTACKTNEDAIIDLSSYVTSTKINDRDSATTLNIPSGVLPPCPGQIDVEYDYYYYCYTFTVKAEKGSERSDSTNHRAFIQSIEEMPSIWFHSIDKPMYEAFEFVVTDRVVFTAGTSEGDASQIHWELSGDVSSKDMGKGKYLVLKKNTLTPGSYSCVSAYANNSFGESLASICFMTNKAPIGGVLRKSIDTGVTLTDIFHFETSRWNDDNFPITYKFVTVDTNGIESTIRTWSSAAFVDTTLKTGIQTIKVYARDSFGSVSSSSMDPTGETQTVTVMDIPADSIPPTDIRSNYVLAAFYETLTRMSEDADQLIPYALDVAIAFEAPCDGVYCDHGTCNTFIGICECVDGYFDEYCSTPPMIDGGVSDEWSEWTICSASCGGGIQYSTKKCDNPLPSNGGSYCDENDMIKYQECNTEVCLTTINGGFGDWTTGECVADCWNNLPGGGILKGVRTYTRKCDNPSPSAPDGLDCGWLGAYTKTEECEVICPNSIPPMECPGSIYDEDSNTYLSECYGNGVCVREIDYVPVSPEDCDWDNPTCIAYCVCDGDYAGASCMRTSDVLDALHSNAAAIFALVQEVADELSMDSLFDNVALLSQLVSDSDILSEDVDDIIVQMLDGIVEYIDELDEEMTEALLAAANSIMSNQMFAKDVSVSSTNTIESIVNELSKTMYPGQSQNSFKLSNMNVAVESRLSHDISSNPLTIKGKYGETGSVDFPDDMFKEDSGIPEFVQLKGIDWQSNPYKNTEQPLTEMKSRVTAINLADKSGTIIPVNNLQKPVELTFPIGSGIDLATFQCTFFDKTTGKWSGQGVAITGLKSVNNVKYVTCTTMHLTDFSATLDLSVRKPEINVVDPVGDADLLLQYNLHNSTPLFILGTITFIFSFLCFLVGFDTRRKKKEFTKMQIETFLKNGNMKATAAQFKEMTIVQRVLYKLRLDHSWGSSIMTPMCEQISLTRHQRIVILAAMTYTAIAVNAMFYGKNTVVIGDKLIAVLISTIALVPSSVLFPKLFKLVNSYNSMTLGVLRAKRKEMKRVNKHTRKEQKKQNKRDQKAKNKYRCKKSSKVGSEITVIVGEKTLTTTNDNESIKPPTDEKDILITPKTNTSNKKINNNSKKEEEDPSSSSSNNGNNVKTEDVIVTSNPLQKDNDKSNDNNSKLLQTSSSSENSKDHEEAVKLKFIAIVIYSFTIFWCFVGLIVLFFKLDNTIYGDLYIKLEIIVIVFILLNTIFGLLSAWKLNLPTLELQSLFGWGVGLAVASLAFIIATMEVFELEKSGIEHLQRAAWKSMYLIDSKKSDFSNSNIIKSQNKYNCCGWDVYKNFALKPCPVKPQGEGCAEHIVKEFKTENLWFVLYTVAMVGLIIGGLYMGHRIPLLVKRIRNRNRKIYDPLKAKKNTIEAAITIQAVYKGFKARTTAVRLREAEAWSSLHKQRAIIAGLAYGFVFIYCIFMLYINLLYGVKFSGSIALAWLKASLTSISLDIILQQPLMILTKAIVAHLWLILGKAH